MTHTNTLRVGGIQGLLNVKASGTYSYHCPVKVLIFDIENRLYFSNITQIHFRFRCLVHQTVHTLQPKCEQF
jgi:hypothetical protein